MNFTEFPRVLVLINKAGYVREGVLRKAVFKDGTLLDRVMFARTRDTHLPYEPFEQRVR